MADQSLFGMADPELVKQLIQAEEARNLVAQSQFTPAQMQNFIQLQAGQQLGKGLSGIVGSLFGVEAVDPRIKRAQQAQSIINEVNASGLDPNTPEYLMQVAKLASSRGLPDLAQMAAGKAQQVQKTQTEINLNLAKIKTEEKKATAEASPFGKIDPSKVTKDSLAKFVQTGKITDLDFLPDTNKGTEFERLIADLPAAEQTAAKANYLKKITAQVMPPSTAALVDREIGTLGSLSFTNSEVKSVISDLQSDKLKLGLTNNFVNTFKTVAGKSDEASRAYARFNGVLESLRNQSLRLNAGVQTEGDAIRALNEFMANYSRYDTKTAIEQLNRVVQKFDAAEQSKRSSLISIGNRYGEDLTSLLPSTTYKAPSAGSSKYSDAVIMQEFNDPKNAAWKSRGFEAFKKKFLELNK